MIDLNELWTSDFGDAYTRRNADTSYNARRAIWEMLLPRHTESVLEVGANVGHNLEAIASLLRSCEMFACEPNEMARQMLYDRDDLWPVSHITADYADKLSFPDRVADLAFTCGVLIHVPTAKLLPSMKEIHRCAKQWIICGEYFAPSEEMVPYRGHDNALWRRDYGSLWLDSFPDLHCHGCTFAWKRMTGLDNLTFWVFEKGRRRH